MKHASPVRGAAPFRTAVPTAALLALLAPHVSHAQASAPSSEEVIELPSFEVSTESADRYRTPDAISAVRVRAPLLETASSISVLTRETLDDLVPTRIFDATRFVAGVQDGRGVQFQDRMILRGFESNGQRTVDNFLQPADADNINEAVVERIEVAKGPNAILAPSGAPGGAINIITKSPRFQTKRSATAVLGLFDAQKFSVDLTGALSQGSPFAYRVIASVQDSERYWASDARLRTRLIAPMLTWKIAPQTTLTVKVVGAEAWIFREPLLVIDSSVNASTSDPYLARGLSPRSRNGIQPWSHVGTHSADAFAQLTHVLNPHVNLRFAANGRYYFEDSDQNFLSTPSLTNRYNPSTGELTQDYVWTKNSTTNLYESTFSPFFNPNSVPNRGDIQWSRRKTGNAQADIVATYGFNGVSTQTVAGAAVSRQTAYTRGKSANLPNLDLTNPVWAYPNYPTTLNTHNKSSFTNYQLYVNERLGFFKDRLFLTGGLLRYETTTTARNALTNSAPSILDDGKTMFSVNALVKVRENISVYYSHSTNSSPVIANNQPLWRDGEQDEVGFKTEFFNQRLGFNAAYFEIQQTNVTIPNPDRQTNPSAPEQLISDFGNKGYELELTGALTKQLSAIASYSHLKMRDSLGRRVRAVADNNAALLLNYRFTDSTVKGLSVNLGVTYTGQRAGDTPVNFTPLGVVGKTSFFLKPTYGTTAGLTYRSSERLTFRLTVDNLLDDKHSIIVAGGRVSGTGITTAPGTNIKLSTTFDF